MNNNIAELEISSLNVKFGKYILHEVTHILHVTSLANKHRKYGDATKFRGYTTTTECTESRLHHTLFTYSNESNSSNNSVKSSSIKF